MLLSRGHANHVKPAARSDHAMKLCGISKIADGAESLTMTATGFLAKICAGPETRGRATVLSRDVGCVFNNRYGGNHIAAAGRGNGVAMTGAERWRIVFVEISRSS
jgi:hypothetical protein